MSEADTPATDTSLEELEKLLEETTRGVWMAAARASSVVGLPVVASPAGRSIANVTFFGLGDGFGNHDAESYANARLIASAPTIARELIDAKRALEGMPTHEELVALWEWMREPDWSDKFGLTEVADWINKRPCATVHKMLALAPESRT